MKQEEIGRYNELVSRIREGETLSMDDRDWLGAHPVPSGRYEGGILADMLPVEPGKEYALTIHCGKMEQAHPVVPTFTVPFGRQGWIRLAGVVGANVDTRNMRQSTKLSFRMAPGVTAVARFVSDCGVLMVSYQAWVPDAVPMPLWYETVTCDRLAMEKTVLSENMVQYSCRGGDGTEDAFRFSVNWTEV